MREHVMAQKYELGRLRREPYVKREAEEKLKRYLQTDLIKVITGPRRAGKSFLAVRVLKENFGYVNFDDEVLAKTEDLNEILKIAHEVYGDFETLFLDEIQNVNGWELFVSRIRRLGYNIVLTGSNSKLLSSELATHLTGRYAEVKVFPFSFGEFLRAKKIEPKVEISPQEGRILSKLSEYLEKGGFPEIAVKGYDYIDYGRMLFDGVNRKRELEVLERAWEEGSRIFVVYGRRRVGKTALLRKFLENKRGIYFLCSQRGYEKDIERFSHEISSLIGAPVRFESFRDAFEFLRSQERLLVVFDEFPYLIEADKGVTSEFQEVVDIVLEGSEITIILCGSSVGMMEREVLGYKSPLYGRASGVLKVKPFRFFDMVEWFGKDFEGLLRLYGVTWGIPKYMEFFKRGSDDEIINNFFYPSAFLFSEARLLLMEELRNPARYMQIIEAIAMGKTRLNEIAQYAGMEAKDLSAYLRVLSNLGIVKREVPVTEKKAKRGIYVIEDEYFRFYHRFVSPHYEDIESLNSEPAVQDFLRNFNTYLGKTFEKASKEFLMELNKRGRLPFKFTKIGKWWHKNGEIDLVALNEREKKALFVEVKWKELREKEARGVLKDLERKSGLVGLESWQKYYGLIAKDIESKKSFTGEGWLLWDLEDFKSLNF